MLELMNVSSSKPMSLKRTLVLFVIFIICGGIIANVVRWLISSDNFMTDPRVRQMTFDTSFSFFILLGGMACWRKYRDRG